MEGKMSNLHKKCLEGKGCDKIDKSTDNCSAYINPSMWWDGAPPYKGHCPLATHIEYKLKENNVEKRRVGQQKQKKV
jgi:hypothetical protein